MPQNPGRNVGGLPVRPAPQERFEEAGGFEDPQLDLFDVPAVDADLQRAFALHPGQVIDGDRSVGHGLVFFPFTESLAARNAGAPALKVRKTRWMAGGSIPKVPRFPISDAVFGVSIGPKHP